MDYKNTLIDSLKFLKDEAKQNGGIFQVRAYEKVINNLYLIKNPITSFEQIQNIEGAGIKIKAKLKEIIETGKLDEIEKLKIYTTDIRSDLLNIYGIGPKKAHDLVFIHNVNSIEDLRQKSLLDEKLLTDAQKIGLKCYEDLLERIPRNEMLIHQKLLNLKDKGEIVGSFRRGSENSGDIDIMVNMTSSEFNSFIDNLIDKKYINYILARGDKKLLAICSLNKGKFRRIDIIRNTPDEYPYMKLYFTGPKEFNVAFRQHCLSLGYSLNEHSFTPKVNGLLTEKDIFNFVGLKYIEPQNRNEKSIINF